MSETRRWVFKKEHGSRHIYENDGKESIMCDLDYYPWCPVDDEAWHLIAAAPELLEALEYVMTAHGEQLTDAFESAQKAIAKARGTNV